MATTENERTADLIATMGTDPEAWAREYMKMPHNREYPDRLLPELTAWFHNAIEAGRHAGPREATGRDWGATPPRSPGERSPQVWGASGFELRTVAVTARASIARLRQFILFDHDTGAAFDEVDWHLGSTINDPAFADDLDEGAIVRLIDARQRQSMR